MRRGEGERRKRTENRSSKIEYLLEEYQSVQFVGTECKFEMRCGVLMEESEELPFPG